MLIWIIIVLIVVVVLLVVVFFFPPPDPPIEDEEEIHYPTIHGRCSESNICGGDLVCDRKSRRCRKPEGGNCAMDVDCQGNLRCINWRCQDSNPQIDHTDNADGSPPRSHDKVVHWATEV